MGRCLHDRSKLKLLNPVDDGGSDAEGSPTSEEACELVPFEDVMGESPISVEDGSATLPVVAIA